MEQQITCINCPQGCRMTVTVEKGAVISAVGNLCKRGENYAKQECIAPERMVTAVVPVVDHIIPVSCKTRSSIPKKEIFNCMKELSKVQVKAPIYMGDIIVANVCDCGVDVIATKTIE